MVERQNEERHKEDGTLLTRVEMISDMWVEPGNQRSRKRYGTAADTVDGTDDSTWIQTNVSSGDRLICGSFSVSEQCKKN